MFLINVKLSLYSMIAFPVLPLLVWWLSSRLHERFKASQEQYALLSARTQESLAGIKVVKSFIQEKNETDTFSDLNGPFPNFPNYAMTTTNFDRLIAIKKHQINLLDSYIEWCTLFPPLKENIIDMFNRSYI